MTNNKYIWAGVGVLVLIGFFVWWGLRQPKEEGGMSAQSVDIVYYYGEECPHCKTVQKFLQDNAISEKVPYVKKEVWHDKANAKELEGRAGECGITPQGMGVPFLWAKGQCFVGDEDVIGYFKKEAGL